jgi:ATP-dependent RNA helicase RhlE
MNQGHVHLRQLEVFVLDEADRMLDMGFLPDLKKIISQLPVRRQSLFFSATLPPAIMQLSHQLLSDPVTVNVTPKSTSLRQIEQQVMFVEQKNKQAQLRKLIRTKGVQRVLVFTRTKRTANNVTEQLVQNGFRVAAIHGNKSQSARERALEAFRRDEVKVLVATDVAARGLDVAGITHVVNFDLPVEPENYVHRIGRTGRAGAVGVAVSFCSAKERPALQAIEAFIGLRVPLAQTPSSPEQGHGTQRKASTRTRRASSKKQDRKRAVSGRSSSRGSHEVTGRPKRERTRGKSGV